MVVRPRKRVAEIREGNLDEKQRSSSLPNLDCELDDELAPSIPSHVQPQTSRSRSFGFSPGMIEKSKAYRQSTHEDAFPELASLQRRDGTFLADGGCVSIKEETISRLQHFVTDGKPPDSNEAKPDSVPTEKKAGTQSPDMTEFVQVSCDEKATRQPSEPLDSESNPYRKADNQQGDQPAESPQLAGQTASSSCATIDSGISVHLSSTETDTSAKSDGAPSTAMDARGIATKPKEDDDSTKVKSAPATASKECQADPDTVGQPAPEHTDQKEEQMEDGTSSHPSDVAAAENRPAAEKEMEDLAAVSGADADTEKSAASTRNRPEGTDETDSSPLPDQHTDNVILSKSLNDPQLAVGLEWRLTEACVEGKSIAHLPIRRPSKVQPSDKVLNVDTDESVSQASPSATAALLSNGSTPVTPLSPAFPEVNSSRQLLPGHLPIDRSATSSSADNNPTSRDEKANPQHPIMSVHSWKWLSAGGCVPPHDDVTKPGNVVDHLGSSLLIPLSPSGENFLRVSKASMPCCGPKRFI